MIAGPHLFLSGQIPMDTEGNLVEGSIADKTEASIKNVRAILAEAGSGIDKVFKVSLMSFLFEGWGEVVLREHGRTLLDKQAMMGSAC
jgi:hypothetical protein